MDGTVYGAGITLAAAYQRFFLTLDNNYTLADVGSAFDYTIKTLMSSVRTGVRDRWRDHNWRLWVGGTQWNTSRDLTGFLNVDVNGTPTPLYFSVVQEPLTQQNFLVGGNIEYNRHVNFLFEYGFLRDVSVFLLGVNARF
jgi:hypothetical protein